MVRRRQARKREPLLLSFLLLDHFEVLWTCDSSPPLVSHNLLHSSARFPQKCAFFPVVFGPRFARNPAKTEISLTLILRLSDFSWRNPNFVVGAGDPRRAFFFGGDKGVERWIDLRIFESVGIPGHLRSALIGEGGGSLAPLLLFFNPMASSPFPADDQRDEDFFDKLVDDEFSIAGSGSDPANMAREIANASIGDVGAPLEDSANAQFAASEKVRQENGVMQAAVAEEKKSEVGSPPSLPAATRAASFGSEESQETMTEIGSPGSSMGKSSTSKGTSVKEVQWSAFNVDSLQCDSGGFGSGTAFFTENVDGPDHQKSSLAENSAADISTFLGSFGQEDAQHYVLVNEQIAEANDPQYWEKLYPGWKFDTNTGHWYHIDGYDAATTAQLENCNVASESMQEGYQDKILGAGNGNISDQRSEISYLQQTAKSITGTIAEDHLTGNISSWNQVSQDNTQYPPNMIFDPQYPDWYYDINTQQWQTLESYTQVIQKTTGNVQDRLSQELKASDGFAATTNSSLSNEVGQHEQSTTKGHGSQEMAAHWNGSGSSHSSHVQQTTWLPAQVNKGVTGFSGNQRIGNSYSSTGCVDYIDHQKGCKTLDSGHNYGDHYSATKFQSFIPEERVYQFNQPKVVQSLQEHLSESYHAHQNSISYAQQPIQSENASYFPFSYAPKEGGPSAGRPPHALVSFGFGGKLIVMKDSCSFGSKLNYGSHGTIGGTVSILGLREIVMDKTDASSNMTGLCHYFHALCQQSFPGPLVGGSAAAKDVNKWIDEKIAQCQSPLMEAREGELLRLLLSLLKILYQHYGKLRSPFGADLSVEDPDGPQAAVTKLFASASKNGSLYGSFTHCMQNVPSEAHIRATAIEVQNLLASAKRKEALQCAQAGQLWGPALVLAAQLGEKFYVDTVRQMAHHQFISGSPLRTLCLLIAGQPAEVFSVESSTNTSFSGADSAAQQSTKVPTDGMLDDWEENLAIITANRTKDDELVIVHLGDCLWKEKGEITAAHTCYLVAEAAFESYSDSARMCLIGADHWKFPRTYASPEAIQRTELYEYSKVLGNSQFILLLFQPYKLVYAYMLAEVGKVSESLRYCQATLKLLKNSSRAPEVEMWKSLLSSLEERIRTHQHGGYSANLAPAKLVGKLFTSIDSTIHRIMGTPASSLPPMPQNGVDGKQSYSVASKVINSQSTMAMSSLIPSGSVEAISEWTVNSGRKTIHSRSISEPDFSRNSNQDLSKDANSTDSQGQTLLSGGPFRFGGFGSQVLQKTMGWVSRSRSDRQAKLGETNKFYYDEKLKRWVEEGAEPPAEEAALPPPPTSASFQNGQSDYNINSPFRSPSIAANGGSEKKSARPSEHSSGIPPMSPSPNQFSVRGRMGVRSRYVDTFNRGRGIMTNSFQSPSASSAKPVLGAKLFVPGIPATSDEQAVDRAGETIQEATTNKEPSTSIAKEKSFSALSPSAPSSMQRISSMNNIAPYGNKGDVAALQNRSSSVSCHTRAASWDGGYGGTLTYKTTEMQPSRDGLGVPSNFIPSNSSSLRLSSSSVQLNGGNKGEGLHEVHF